MVMYRKRGRGLIRLHSIWIICCIFVILNISSFGVWSQQLWPSPWPPHGDLIHAEREWRFSNTISRTPVTGPVTGPVTRLVTWPALGLPLMEKPAFLLKALRATPEVWRFSDLWCSSLLKSRLFLFILWILPTEKKDNRTLFQFQDPFWTNQKRLFQKKRICWNTTRGSGNLHKHLSRKWRGWRGKVLCIMGNIPSSFLHWSPWRSGSDKEESFLDLQTFSSGLNISNVRSPPLHSTGRPWPAELSCLWSSGPNRLPVFRSSENFDYSKDNVTCFYIESDQWSTQQKFYGPNWNRPPSPPVIVLQNEGELCSPIAVPHLLLLIDN